jgi:hypothetical protein
MKLQKTILYSAMVVALISGSGDIILIKSIDGEEALGIPYHHPFLQVFVVFLGELSALGGFWIY